MSDRITISGSVSFYEVDDSGADRMVLQHENHLTSEGKEFLMKKVIGRPGMFLGRTFMTADALRFVKIKVVSPTLSYVETIGTFDFILFPSSSVVEFSVLFLSFTDSVVNISQEVLIGDVVSGGESFEFDVAKVVGLQYTKPANKSLRVKHAIQFNWSS